MSNKIECSGDVYLASKSPRRRELLEQIGVRYQVVSVDVPEVHAPQENASDYVQRLAREKATAASEIYCDKPVLGADTIVVCGEQIMEKPSNREEAINMLMILSGREHRVMTAVSLVHQSRHMSKLCETRVTFRPISEAEADRYWQTGEPKDKAGGYGIQGLGGVFVSNINGSYSAVVGLPIAETSELLTHFTIPVWQAN